MKYLVKVMCAKHAKTGKTSKEGRGLLSNNIYFFQKLGWPELEAQIMGGIFLLLLCLRVLFTRFL